MHWASLHFQSVIVVRLNDSCGAHLESFGCINSILLTFQLNASLPPKPIHLRPANDSHDESDYDTKERMPRFPTVSASSFP